MADRRDALAGAAEVMAGLERHAIEIGEQVVVTVGRLNVLPGAVNVIPSRVELTVDFRAPADDHLSLGEQLVREWVETSCINRKLSYELVRTEHVPARLMSTELVDRARRVVPEIPVTVSGALHDSAVIAPFIPTVMLFVPSRDGISHNPAEFSRMEDIAAAAEVVERVVRRPTITQLNAMDRATFVGVCGRFFEHSPWIAEQTWDSSRPFGSISDLHEKLCATLTKSSEAEKLALIRAHPDLVGRLARENKLTRESTGEQAAAGLDALTAPEAAAFEQYNAQYREKFGFPFVICARQNRKEAILAAFPMRLKNSATQEMATAIGEIEKIAGLRLKDAVWED
jgi:OHCU decarboxylase